jgi:hypothetical protein
VDEAVFRNAAVDRAIFFLCSDFLEVTRIAKVSASVDLESVNSADFSGLSGFMAARIIRARVDEDTHYTDVRDDLSIVPAGDVLDRLNCSSSTDTPVLMGFTDSTTAIFYPTPSDDGTITVVYAPVQAAWQFGTKGAYAAGTTYYIGDLVDSSGIVYRSLTDNNTGNTPASSATSWESQGAGSLIAPGSITTVIPDAYLGQLLEYGAFGALQRKLPEHAGIAGPAFEQYRAWRDSMRGVGSISGKSSMRESHSGLASRGGW